MPVSPEPRPLRVSPDAVVLQAEPVSSLRHVLGESARWNHDTAELWWTDLLSGQYITGRWTGEVLADIAITEVDDVAAFRLPKPGGGMVVADRATLAWTDAADQPTGFASLPIRPDERINDGQLDPAGRVVVGTMNDDAFEERGTLWLAEPSGEVVRLVDGGTIPNGVAFSPSGREMYWIDSDPGVMSVFPYDPSQGALGPLLRSWSLADGAALPDGMAIDGVGMVWVALWDGGRVVRLNPSTGTVLATVRTPARRPTSCALGGPENDVLFITTATLGLDSDDSGHDGRVLACGLPPSARLTT